MRRPLLSERFTKPPRALTIEPYLDPADRPVSSGPGAHRARLVPLVVLDYGSLMARMRQLRHIGRYMGGALLQVLLGARSVRRNPHTGRNRIDPATLRELEDYAHSLGVTDIGYTDVDPRHIFAGARILSPHAVVFTMEMKREKIKMAPSIPSFIEIFRTYYGLGVAVNRVSDFLRERGFDAHPSPAIGGEVNYIPLAIDAGLGYSGKNGLLITRNNGPRVRLAAVYTTIENLPTATDNPYAWIRDFCATCNACIRRCPADAIYHEPRIADDGWPSFVDHTKCAGPFSNDNGCTLCIKYCPFSFADHDTLKKQYDAHDRRHGEARPG